MTALYPSSAGWMRLPGWGNRGVYRHTRLGTFTRIQTRVFFGKRHLSYTMTSCDKCRTCVQGVHRDWAERHEQEHKAVEELKQAQG